MGNEFEVFGHSFQWHNKTQNLIAEKTGRTTIDVPMRNQHDQNLWQIRTARTPQEQFDESLLVIFSLFFHCHGILLNFH